MTEQEVPPGTTLLVRGGRVLSAASDWHQPDTADIAISARVATLQPWLDEAHARTMAAPLDINRLPRF